jgi:spermidine synthase/16S rRNA U1498 N3-methylase RsmE
VLGGGDGGSTDELLKHPSIGRVAIAELDAEVIRIARRHLQSVHRGALDDPRVRIEIGDGFEYVRRGTERFDLILLDLTDPDTPAQRLYTREFFEAARRRLAPGGALVLHLGSPVFDPDRVRRLLADLHTVYPIVRPMGMVVPLYGGYWGMAVASETLDPVAIDPPTLEQRLGDRGLSELQYFNAQVHAALFALPNFYRCTPARGLSTESPPMQPRLYLPAGSRVAAAGERLEVTGDQDHYLRRVLRLREGATLEVFDGEGSRSGARWIPGRDRDGAIELDARGWHVALPASPLSIVLLQGISTAEKMDWTIEKAVELGVDAIVPVAAERSVVKLDAGRGGSPPGALDAPGDRRLHAMRPGPASQDRGGGAAGAGDRVRSRSPRGTLTCRAAAASAGDRSGRGPNLDARRAATPPAATQAATSAATLGRDRGTGDLAGAVGLVAVPEGTGPVRLMLAAGPESGWSDEELSEALAAGFQRVSIGSPGTAHRDGCAGRGRRAPDALRRIPEAACPERSARRGRRADGGRGGAAGRRRGTRRRGKRAGRGSAARGHRVEHPECHVPIVEVIRCISGTRRAAHRGRLHRSPRVRGCSTGPRRSRAVRPSRPA